MVIERKPFRMPFQSGWKCWIMPHHPIELILNSTVVVVVIGEKHFDLRLSSSTNVLNQNSNFFYRQAFLSMQQGLAMVAIHVASLKRGCRHG